MLGFDILALLALSFTRKDARSARTSHPSRWILAALLALIASTAFAGIWLKRPSQSVVYFEPSDWLGKPLPLLAYMDIGHRLEKGRWIVVIYNSYCGHCRPVIPEYEQLAVQWTGRQDVPGIALIELPPPAPPGRNPATGQTSALLGHLAAQRKWFIITPAIMAIENGRVVAVAGEEPPATWASQAFDRR